MFLLFLTDSGNGKISDMNLHSNMFLLFPCLDNKRGTVIIIYIPICFYYFRTLRTSPDTNISFTFQYVSIISLDGYFISGDPKHLHSNMFLLFRNGLYHKRHTERHLHSNMFLLFQVSGRCTQSSRSHLHSNMFLLFPVQCSPL